MANKRVFYACEAVGIGRVDPDNELLKFPIAFVHGVQSVGITTNFNVESIFELGQSAPYEQVETNPEIEVTLEKVIDGWPFIYHMATSGVGTAAQQNNLEARLKNKCNVAMMIGPDEYVAVSGTPPVEMFMSGMYVNSLTYTFPSDGNATESVTLVGNHKAWNADPVIRAGVNAATALTGLEAGPMYGWLPSTVANISPPNKGLNEDYPIGYGRVVRREDVVMYSSIMPTCIFGVIPQFNVGNNWDAVKQRPRAHISNLTISMGDAGREDIYELGHKQPYYKSAAGSKEVTTEIEVLTVSGDFLGIYSGRDTAPEQLIYLHLSNGATFDLGSKNKLTSVSYGGGEAGGSNLTITYSFTTQNDLTITPPTVFDILP